MQTFVPYPDLELSASVLDRQRLGKQRVETYQILRANLGLSKGWVNHPASLMWANNTNGLIAYGAAMCNQWISRGYKDTTLEKILALGTPDATDMPAWWGLEELHSSHRSNLLRKDPIYYAAYGWDDDPAAPYIWPTVAV